VSFAWRATVLVILTVSIASLPFTAEDQPQQSPEEQAWQILRSGLQDRKASNRTAAVQTLSLLPGNRRATTFALSALQDRNADVRTAAAVALGQQHARTAIPALKSALNDSEIPVVLAAAHSLLLLKDQSAYQIFYAVLMGDKKSSEGLVQSQLNRLKDPKQLAQIGFSEGIGFVPFGGMGYEAYRTIHKHDSSPVRATVARFLADDPDPISEDALIQTALADKDEIVRLAALDALTQRGDPNCIKRLLKNLSDDEKPAVRYRTAAVILHLSAVAEKRRKH
jgi:HEAT repeat protein